MKARLICTLLLILTVINSCTGQQNVIQDLTVGNINYHIDENSVAHVIAGDYKGAVVVPASIKHMNKTYKVEHIGHESFRNSNELTSIKLPETIKTIGVRAFEHCHLLTSIAIPESVETINEYAFSKCQSLKTIHIPKNVKLIGNSPFSYCESLESITVDANNTHYESIDGVLYDIVATSVIKVPETKTTYEFPTTVIEIRFGAFENCRFLKSIDIPKAVTQIPQNCFDNCNSVTQFNLHENIYSIGRNAFSKCNSLEAINVDKNNPNYASVDGILYDYNKKILIQCPPQKGDVTIVNGTERIKSWAFLNNQKIKSITIPESVIAIEEASFMKCENLKSVRLESKDMINFKDEFRYLRERKVTIWFRKEAIESYKNSPVFNFENVDYRVF